jgi:muramoyltetrapeptide carboxypeptidase
VPRLIKPRAVAPGATVGLAAPGGPVDPEKFAAGEALLKDAGFRTVRRDDLFDRRCYLAGDDSRRVAEFMELVDDDRVDAILCARGGYGCDRIVERLDARRVRAARKALIGYSDVTALLLWQRRCAGLVGFHGPMLDRGGDVDAAALERLFAQLRGDEALPLVFSGTGNGGGRASGRLVGGSLTLVAASIGTPWEIDTRGAILLLEDVGERPYRIDRMLQQLRGAGKLAAVAGVGIGDFSSCVDDRFPETTVEDVILEALEPFGLPVVTGLPFGHVRDNFAWPLGGRATIDAGRGEIHVLEHGVSKAA